MKTENKRIYLEKVIVPWLRWANSGDSDRVYFKRILNIEYMFIPELFRAYRECLKMR